MTLPDDVPTLNDVAGRDATRGYLAFLDHVVVDAQPDKRPFRQIAEPWQWHRAHRAAGALDQLAGLRDDYTGKLSFWEEYHKGSDKTHEDARELLFLLAFANRPLNCYVVAGSEDQAALVTKAMQGICRDNSWVAERVGVSTLGAWSRTNGSTLTVLPKRPSTGQGIFPDFVIASEVTHWLYEEGQRMWEFVLESVNKRPRCVLKVETNAGMKATWQWSERERVRRSPYWSFYAAPVGPPLPTWMNQAKIDDDSQGLTAGERDRLYRNRWVDPGEELGYLTVDEALMCRDPALWERSHGERDREYKVVIDYGGVKDRCALCVMHAVDGEDKAIVDRLDCWQGTHENRIAIDFDPERPQDRFVEKWLMTVLNSFHVSEIIVDPQQLEGLAIKYERRGWVVTRFEYRGGKTNTLLCAVFKNAVQNRRVSWSPWAGLLPEQYAERGRTIAIEDRTLEQEIGFLVTKPTAWGRPRLDHEAGRHDDRVVAVAMGILHVLGDALPAGDRGPTATGVPPDDPLYARRPAPADRAPDDPEYPEGARPPDSARDRYTRDIFRHGFFGLGDADEDGF